MQVLVDRKLFFLNILALPIQGALTTVPANQGIIDLHIMGLGDSCLTAKAVNGERSTSDVQIMRYELSQEIRFLDGGTPRPKPSLKRRPKAVPLPPFHPVLHVDPACDSLWECLFTWPSS